jgi:hypothetical protein
MDDLIRPLVDFLPAHPNLLFLDISQSSAGKSLYPLLQCLGANTTLTSLDVSGIYRFPLFLFFFLF